MDRPLHDLPENGGRPAGREPVFADQARAAGLVSIVGYHLTGRRAAVVMKA